MKSTLFYKTLLLLTPRQRKKGIVITFLLVVSSLLDFFSLASFVPLILLVINPSWTEGSTLVQTMGFSSPVSFSLSLTVLVLLFIAVKTRINQWIAFRKAAYAYGVGNDLADAAITRYLRIPYHDFTHVDFAGELNRLTNVPLTFANNIIIPAGTLISETIILITLCTAIAWYQFSMFALLLLILLPAFFVYRMKRKQAAGISNKVAVVYPRLLKHTLQIVEGIIDIRSYHRESFFKRRFDEAGKEVARVFALDHTSQTATSRTTELVAAFCVCLVLAYAITVRQNQKETLLLLSLFVGVSFRIVPSVNRIFSAMHQIRTNEHVLEELPAMTDYDENALDENSLTIPFHSALLVENLSFAYPGHGKIFDNASLRIAKGETIAVTGVSGKGKTTFFLILLGLLRQQKGQILLDGKNANETNSGSWLKSFCYVPQQPYMLDASIMENIAFGTPAGEIKEEKINSILRQLELEEWISGLPDGIRTIVGEKGLKISGGQRQRLAIARGLYHDRQILLLDEVTNQLDSRTEAEIFASLKRVAGDKTILMITHHPELLKQFDRVFEVVNGVFREISHHPLSAV